ncbi:MAG: preprotein translocase subunit SecY [Anaerolineaceae bacterium]|nr:preprotein translocase subunit SecY [Anaerolineaceae bacterium]
MKKSAWRYLWTSVDIRKKLLITLALLILYRLAANIPVPGINRDVIASIFQQQSAASSLLGVFDMLSGGTLSKFSILAMGVYPYITAQIIIQLLIPIIPSLERRMQENPKEGRKLMEKWTVLLTIPMGTLSALGQIQLFNQLTTGGSILNYHFGFTGVNLLPTLTTLVSMLGGTMLGIWLGELISEYGVPNQGLSLIIFAGIVSRIPVNLYRLIVSGESVAILLTLMVLILSATIFAIVFVQQGRRNVPVLFPGRRMGNRMSMPVRSNLPLMINLAGMIPLIFAQTILSLPAILAQFFINSKAEWLAKFASGMQRTFSPTSVWYVVIYFLFVLLLTFFYTEVLFEQQNYGDSLKRQGAQIPGVVRGAPTERYLNKVQRRITLVGALFLAVVATLPYVLQITLPVNIGSNLFLVSASGLIIVVGVVRDTFNIIETELKLHGYDESLLKG